MMKRKTHFLDDEQQKKCDVNKSKRQIRSLLFDYFINEQKLDTTVIEKEFSSLVDSSISTIGTAISGNLYWK